MHINAGFAVRSPLVALLATTRPAVRMAAPEIEWQDAVVLSNTPVADSQATRQLRVKAAGPLDYKPGHILGFGFEEEGDSKQGPYTVTRSSGSTLDIVYRVIPDGRKTPAMAAMAAGAPVRFGGRFGTPIDEGIAPEVERVVGIATGAGLAPLVGYAEQALLLEDGPRIELYGGFASLEDACCATELDALAAAHPAKFSWTACISRLGAAGAGTEEEAAAKRDAGGAGGAWVSGRVTSAVPPLLRTTRRTHFHLIGNGARASRETAERWARSGRDLAERATVR